MTGQSSSQAATPIQWWKPALFFLVVIAGLWYVKWQPYYGKAFTAAETHSIGKSILAQADANPWQAALDYAMIYFLAVDGRCAGILDGESVVKPGDAGVYGVRPRLGFCGDSSGGGAGDGVADCEAGAKMGA